MAETIATKLEGYIQQTISEKLPTAAGIATQIDKELTPKMNETLRKALKDESEKTRTALVQAVQIPTEMQGAQQFEGEFG